MKKIEEYLKKKAQDSRRISPVKSARPAPYTINPLREKNKQKDAQ